MDFGIIEIGSTNTKAYIYKNGKLLNLGSINIPFKDNFKQYNHFLEKDINILCDFIKNIKKDVGKIYAFGTSIFRKISKDELNHFEHILEEKFNIKFKVVSSEEENIYTVNSVLANNDYAKRMIVVIGGGGSTEIALVENKKILKMINLDFGAMDITDRFPDLKDDITKTNFDEILSYASKLVDDLDMKSDVMVLAGGDYLYFYETVGYKMEKNNIYEAENQPYMIDFNTFDKYDHDILTRSLDEIRSKCPGNEGWWNGARGMRFCMNAIARKVDAKYIIPTRINMLIGIANYYKEKI